MHCIKINIRSVIFIILIIFLNVVNQSNSSDNDALKSSSIDLSQKHNNVEKSYCPSDIECFKLGDPCIKCAFSESCVYGSSVNATCHAVGNCTGEKKICAQFVVSILLSDRKLGARVCVQCQMQVHLITSSILQDQLYSKK